MSHKRIVAQCFVDGIDISKEMVCSGHAVDWPKFSGGYYRAIDNGAAVTDAWSLPRFVDPHAWLTQTLARIARGWADLSGRPAHAAELQSLNGLSLALTIV